MPGRWNCRLHERLVVPGALGGFSSDWLGPVAAVFVLRSGQTRAAKPRARQDVVRTLSEVGFAVRVVRGARRRGLDGRATSCPRRLVLRGQRMVPESWVVSLPRQSNSTTWPSEAVHHRMKSATLRGPMVLSLPNLGQKKRRQIPPRPSMPRNTGPNTTA